jgi:hypothetical protein
MYAVLVIVCLLTATASMAITFVLSVSAIGEGSAPED